MRTRVKICGITRVEDACNAIEAGADALGLVFYPPSPRNVKVEQAIEIAGRMPPFVTLVGLFVNAEREFIADVIERIGIELIQFHGNESPGDCMGHGRPFIKAVRMKPDVDLAAECERYEAATGLLLDAYHPGKAGGTGQSFEWDRIPPSLGPEIILAGGLTPTNVSRAIRKVKPYAVDVSGGVESAPGIKDPEKIKRFMRGIQVGDL